MPYAGRARFYSMTDNEKNSNVPVQPGTLNEIMTAKLVKEKASAKKVLIESESITLETGAAGTTGMFSFNYDYILDEKGLYLGMYQDSSVDFTSTALLNEVEYKGENPITFLAGLSNGQYAIDYACGICFYKKADSSTSATANYLIRIVASDAIVNMESTGLATENTLTNVLNSLTLDEKAYDTIELTYVAPGNDGAGEVETVIYKDGVTTLYTLTLTYNSDNKLVSVVRS